MEKGSLFAVFGALFVGYQVFFRFFQYSLVEIKFYLEFYRCHEGEVGRRSWFFKGIVIPWKAVGGSEQIWLVQGRCCIFQGFEQWLAPFWKDGAGTEASWGSGGSGIWLLGRRRCGFHGFT